MNVVYYSSDFFAEMCGVAIQSLCECNTEEKNICIYIVEDQISDKNKQRLRSITDRYHRELVFIRMPSQEEYKRPHFQSSELVLHCPSSVSVTSYSVLLFPSH